MEVETTSNAIAIRAFAARRILRCLVFAALAAGASSAVAQDAEPGMSSSFTSDERTALERGELVRRSLTRQGGGRVYIGGTSWQVIDASPEAVWAALGDTPQFRQMFPRVSEARNVVQGTLSPTHHERVIRFTHAVGIFDASYYVRARFDNPNRDISFRLEPGHDNALDSAWGFFQVREYSAGRALLTYGIMADAGDGLLSGLLRPTIHDWMLRVPWTVKRFIERSGNRYAHAR